MRFGTALAGLLAALLTGTLLTAAPASAEGGTLTLTAPPRVRMGQPTTLTAHVADEFGPADKLVTFQQKSGSEWVDLGQARSSDNGDAVFTKETRRLDSVYRAMVTDVPPNGDLFSDPVTVEGYRVRSTLTLSANYWYVKDEQSRALTATWKASSGDPVVGRVTLWSNPRNGTWTRVSTQTTRADGVVRWVVRPRVDTYYKLTGSGGFWWLGDVSNVRMMDNRPSGIPVKYPRAAPRPQHLPAQRRAVGAGANPTISRIPNAVWRNMVGRSWHSGCPIGRASLRLIRINYWDFSGYRRRGEMVVRSSIAGKTVGALREMYNRNFPIRAMYRVDRFGWSSRSHGADDYASMRHDNTSAFNCRSVTGSPGVRSPHSYGKAIDVNTWENPYHSAQGILPDVWWAHHSHPRIAWRSGSHPVVKLWRKHGFHWTYGTQDSQHWDGRQVPTEGLTFVG